MPGACIAAAAPALMPRSCRALPHGLLTLFLINFPAALDSWPTLQTPPNQKARSPGQAQGPGTHAPILPSPTRRAACASVWWPDSAPNAAARSIPYSTTPRNGNRANGNHLDQSLRSSQKNRNSLTWVQLLVALTVCFTYPVLYRVSSESRAGEWEL